ncbi:oligomeric golgi complex component, COG2-domain-containing protein [Roridomyces roridus]|uniref:Conserved oligomeric Golgi complex subunit 2 n=1 Tax=Roridomyces roridus TaxID=1738132 RepID=A0AAD7G0G1_9AGAR|nr:oligomeric golgi complex component, COG2-domain-containing protein [Roridomyces roridus]
MASTSRDPFELDRLAEELATREKSREDSDDATGHELPIYIPLSHTNPYLTSEVFDVEAFLLSRSHTSLRDLRSELRDYLSTLKEELVKLINDDYEAFISLSTDLRGEGARLERIKQPLGHLKTQILASKSDLQVIQDAIQEKLTKRATLRAEKALLHLLLKISESVTRLESLLLIASPAQDEESEEPRPVNLNLPEDNVDDRTHGNRAKHLSRVAAEYSQLLYHANKAREEKCVFVDEIQWRIDRIRSTLSSDLDHLFSTTLLSLTGEEGKTSEVEKAKTIADITECLRTYDSMGLWRDAEDVLRRDVVRRFVKKSIFPGALAAPQSPIVPHTPFRSSTTPASLATPSALPPRTPYTPFTSFALKTPFNHSLGSASHSPYAHILDDSEDPLASLFSQILRFVERDMSKIMVIADKVSLKSVSTARKDGFEILANVVWEEFGRAIMDELGLVVFAAGRPNEFRKHYEITNAFIRSLEFLAPSVHSVEAMRAHPVYTAFERRWQLPVYYQLRWKEIVSKVEDVLSVPRVELSSAKEKTAFASTQATAIWVAISACWSAEVFIPELTHRFWRLTLQLLSRYKTWLSESMVPDSIPVDPPSAESIAEDDKILRQYAMVILDARELHMHVLALWQEEISLMLPEAAGEERANLEDTLRESLSALTATTAPMSTHIVAILTKRCCDALLPVRSISSQFRAMSNKQMPKEPSYFVSSILRPVKVFFGIGVGQGPGESLKEHFLVSYATEIFESVAQRYVHHVAGMKKTEDSLRRLKKGKKQTFSLFGGNTKEEEGKDEERIRAQMILDVEAFGKDGQLLGVDLEQSEAFKTLTEMVHAVDGEAPPFRLNTTNETSSLGQYIESSDTWSYVQTLSAFSIRVVHANVSLCRRRDSPWWRRANILFVAFILPHFPRLREEQLGIAIGDILNKIRVT